jgi:hypothetical protein
VKALRFLVVFLAVTVTVTVAALTAFFIFWSVVPAQPGTATALAMLFLVAPGVGIASGLLWRPGPSGPANRLVRRDGCSLALQRSPAGWPALAAAWPPWT